MKAKHNLTCFSKNVRVVILEPLMYWTLGILDFFITFTMELQYIIPKFIGTSLIDIPYSIFKINQKKYKK